MQFEIDKTVATLVNLNLRAELHGEDKKTAADLKIRVDLTNDSLAMFAPTLKDALFFFDKGADHDLIDQAEKHDKNYKPHLRFDMLPSIKWADETVGAELTIYRGISDESNIKLELCTIDGFVIEPKMGGTCTITMRVQAHPDEQQVGHLAMMIGTKIEISIEVPEYQAELE